MFSVFNVHVLHTVTSVLPCGCMCCCDAVHERGHPAPHQACMGPCRTSEKLYACSSCYFSLRYPAEGLCSTLQQCPKHIYAQTGWCMQEVSVSGMLNCCCLAKNAD